MCARSRSFRLSTKPARSATSSADSPARFSTCWSSTTDRQTEPRGWRGVLAPRSSSITAIVERVTPCARPSPWRSNARFTHALVLDGDMQHLPSEAPRLLEEAARSGADVVLGERRFAQDGCPPPAITRTGWAAGCCSWFVGSRLRDTQCGFRVFRLDALRGVPLRARGYDIETEMLVKLSPARRDDRDRSGDGRLHRPAQQAATGARYDAHLFSGGLLPLHRTPVTCLESSTRSTVRAKARRRTAPSGAAALDAARPEQRPDLRGDLLRRSTAAASRVVRDRPRGHVDRVADDAANARGDRRTTWRRCFRARTGRRSNAARSRRCAATRAT